jgi:hypothetical protein
MASRWIARVHYCKKMTDTTNHTREPDIPPGSSPDPHIEHTLYGDKFDERETQLALALKTARIVVSASLAPATSESRPCSGKL